MKASLVISSRNGARVLSEVIAAARTSLERAGDGELILVDSSSTDNTGSLMREAARSPGVTALALTQIGVSRARNAGWAVATGDVVLFTDDDIIVPLDWVETMTAPIEAGYDATAGTVHLPEHLTESLSPRQREFLADTRSMNLGIPPRTIVSASMGLRRNLYDLGFRFDHRLDPGALGYMGDTLFHLQLTEAGGQTQLVESVPVLHRFDEARLEPAMWTKRARLQGICEAWIKHHWCHDTPTLRDWKAFGGAEVRARHLLAANDGESLDLVARAAAGRWWLAHRFSRRQYARREVPARIR